jgi:hypothetical protein
VAAQDHSCFPVFGIEDLATEKAIQHLHCFKFIATLRDQDLNQPVGGSEPRAQCGCAVQFLNTFWIEGSLAGEEFRLVLVGQQFLFPRADFSKFMEQWKLNNPPRLYISSDC